MQLLFPHFISSTFLILVGIWIFTTFITKSIYFLRLKDWFSLDRILEFFDDKVEIVPPVVGEQTGVEGERDLRNVGLGVVPSKVFDFS